MDGLVSLLMGTVAVAGSLSTGGSGMLADIIRKMEAHQYKKRALYRSMSVAHGEP